MDKAKQKKNINYRQVFAKKANAQNKVLKACPDMGHFSGIYFYIRTDVDGKKYAYIGKAIDLLERNASHMLGYQHIDVSIREKRGFYSESNPFGWKLNFLRFPQNQLDEKEAYYIKAYLDAGYTLYNVESGGTTGKTMINERKPAKGYYDGLKQARKKLKEELRYIIDRYLIISLKKDGKLAQKALEKFNNLIYKDENDENEEENVSHETLQEGEKE